MGNDLYRKKFESIYDILYCNDLIIPDNDKEQTKQRLFQMCWPILEEVSTLPVDGASSDRRHSMH